MNHGYAKARRATGASQPESSPHSAHHMLEREAERQARLRKAQEDENDARRKKEAEIRRQEEEVRKVEEDIKRKKREFEENSKKQKELEKEEIKRAIREAKEEADLWASKKRIDSDKKVLRKLQRDPGTRVAIPTDSVRSPISPVMQDDITSPTKISFFKRWRIDDYPTSPPPDIPRPKTSGGEEAQPKQAIIAGGGGIVPQIDAPVSAVNHGDRRVRVSARGSSILLPVKPNTTPLQLIRASVTFFTFPIDPRNSLLIESFSKTGIQRPLRMYEHVRDVLNSWDSDDQHQLVLEPYDSASDTKLFSAAAPKTKPQGGAWWMYFLQKKGKWDKRYVILTPEGQITVAKNETGKEKMNVCNLSDFEIFTLTREGEKKKIRPPKKNCYAIKSMQKSSMFLGETDFIHLFCCSDERQGRDFHDAIFRWRTWYLVFVMGEGTHGPPKIGENPLAATSAPLLSPGHRRRESKDSQYILGSFATGLDFDAGNFEINYDDKPRTRHKRLGSDQPLASAIAVPSGENGAPSAVEHTKALHARQLSIRRAANTVPPTATHHARAPSIDKPPQSSGLSRGLSVKSTRNGRPSVDVSRGPVAIADPAPPLPGIRPLIDLTPQYVAPPQHQVKGRGFKPAAVGAGGLVANATGPNLGPGVVVIPESREWRPRGISVTQVLPPSAGLDRTTSVRSSKGGRGLLGDLGGNEGFTGNGLLGSRIDQSTRSS